VSWIHGFLQYTEERTPDRRKTPPAVFLLTVCVALQLPINAAEPEWAMVMSDLDVITRADLNDIFAAAPQGMAFYVVADASSSHALLPYPVVNGADKKARPTAPLRNTCSITIKCNE
jgi:hypothetical protein